MKSLRTLTPLFRLFFALLIVALALVLLLNETSVSTGAKQSQTSPQERQIENLIPKHVPIDVKITKEREKNWKDLKNENWARDFEIEITNTGEKPVYTLALLLFFDVPHEFGDYFAVTITYGRPKISNPRFIATGDDIPIKPGESKILAIHPSSVLSWEKNRREKGYRLPTKVKIMLQLLSFGDGTGLMRDKEGILVPIPYHRGSFASPARGKYETVGWRQMA